MSCHACRVIAENSEGTHCEPRVTDAIPVAIVVSWCPPPSEIDTRVGVALKTPIDTEVEDRPHDLRLLLGSPVVVEPVVSDGKCSREFGNIKEMLGIPVVSTVTKGVCCVPSGVLWNMRHIYCPATEHIVLLAHIPVALARRGQRIWSGWTSDKRKQGT